MTPLKAIRLKCLECSADTIKEVRLCPVHDCELYQYRMGHNPKRKGLGGKPPTQRAKTEVKLEPNVRFVTGTPPTPCMFCGGREFHKDDCRFSPIIR